DVQWESGRALWRPDPRGATKAQVQELLEVARQHHVKVIPLISSLGDSEWVFAGLRDEALCAEVAYIPKQLREQGRPQVTCDRARGVYPAVYDPERTITVNGTATTLNEALIFPILKEAIDLFRPAYLHLGHDEVRGPSGLRYDMELYLRDIVTLSRFLRAAGVRPMVWGDVLWERRTEAQAAHPARRGGPGGLPGHGTRGARYRLLFPARWWIFPLSSRNGTSTMTAPGGLARGSTTICARCRAAGSGSAASCSRSWTRAGTAARVSSC